MSSKASYRTSIRCPQRDTPWSGFASRPTASRIRTSSSAPDSTIQHRTADQSGRGLPFASRIWATRSPSSRSQTGEWAERRGKDHRAMSNDRRFLESSPLSGCLVRLEPYEEAVKAQVRVALSCDLAARNLFAIDGQGDHFKSFWSNIEREVSAPSCSCSSTPFSGERD